MCTTSQSFANTGLATISTANPNRNGSGSITAVLTGANSGTKVYSIFIKAVGSTSEGMVRFYINTGGGDTLLKEVYIPACIPSGTTKAFETTLEENLILKPSDILSASTENADEFNIIADGVDWLQCECSEEACNPGLTTSANTGIVNINKPNNKLDGSGPVSTVITSPTGNLNGGTLVETVNIKATASVSQGMVRLFVNDGVSNTNYLIHEVLIPASTQTNIQPAYRTTTYLGLHLAQGYSLLASTQNANDFNVIADGTDVINCPC